MENLQQRIEHIRGKLLQAREDADAARADFLTYAARDNPDPHLLELIRATYECRRRAVANWRAELYGTLADRSLAA